MRLNPRIVTNSTQELNLDRKSFVEHLDDLRRCVIRSAVAILLGTIVGYVFCDPILKWFTEPIQSEIGNLYFFSPADAFIVRLKTSFLAGCLVTSPFVLTQIWLYVSPGLYPQEKKALIPWMVFSWSLFLLGAAFAFKVVLPLGLQFLLGFQTEFLKPMIAIHNYISFTGSLILAFGIAFNIPVFLLALVSLGLVQVSTLIHYRKHAYVGVFILGMILTPPDVISQILLALPLIVLYEISIIGSKMIKSKKGEEPK